MNMKEHVVFVPVGGECFVNIFDGDTSLHIKKSFSSPLGVNVS